MATILKTNDKKMPFIYNISQGVGFNKPNLLDDVQLVQVLLLEIVPLLGVKVIKPHPSVNGVFDAVTGFWIYKLQDMLDTKIDGIISPVTGNDAYTGGKKWTLYGLNELLHWNVAHKFGKLHEDPRLSQTLRNSIKPALT